MRSNLKLIFILFIIGLLTSCSQLDQQLSYPTTVHSVCEPNESLLICDSADKKECYGWLGDKPIYIEEEL
jgi:hypothetical protein